MTWTTDIDTTDLERVERPAPKMLPPIDSFQIKSPFYISQVPTTATVSPDAVNNFRNPGIPSYRITPPQPLSLAGSGTNAVPTLAISSFNILAPPSPTISQTLTTIPIGYQFSFFQVQLPLGSRTTISTYKIYRSTTSSNTNAQVIQTISHNPSNAGVPIIVQDAQPNGVTQFYWVSAVSTAGLESSMVPAQTGTVVNNAGFNATFQLANSFHNNPVNVAFTPTSTTNLSNDGISHMIVVSAGTNQFAPAGVSYNSGTVDPGNFGTWYIFADDPLFQGGAVAYQFSATPPNQTAADGRLPFGKITTVNGTAKTGGGYTGGTTPGGGGGRGYIQ
jgi:hypothetical protein